jgi:CRISPR-associated protein Cas2
MTRSKQFVLVVYDISSDKRRTRLHNLLLNFGSPVQYSVFECLLDAEGLQSMKRAIRKAIKPKVDRVRTYYLCQACLPKTEVSSGVDVLSEPDVIIV